METPLTILYTHSLRGDLDSLPRIYSFLRQLKAYYRSEEVVQICALDPAQAPGRVLLLDLGQSCDPAAWHCEVSGGRSMLVVLDGMGCDAARIDQAAATRAKLGDSVRLALVDAETPVAIEDVLLTTAVSSPRPARVGEGSGVRGNYTLQIVLSPAESTHLDDDTLTLAALSGSQQVGAAVLTRQIGHWILTAHAIHDLPRRALPDPTITAAVAFVISEARYAQKRQSS